MVWWLTQSVGNLSGEFYSVVLDWKKRIRGIKKVRFLSQSPRGLVVEAKCWGRKYLRDQFLPAPRVFLGLF